MNDLASAEYTIILAILKIGAIVYTLLHLLTMLVISKQTLVVGRLVKTKLRVPIMIYAALHVILLFLILILAVVVNPAR
ncbi:MAG: hypothetical protein QY330_02590 [Candidatus Dojkabacteria bacterium]|uniref:Uncharacterized protein n=1 Tax=Candidatus Dojkabacteria bacterium TaxID=2099670 RepID=A0A952DVW0_9BACT|nr:hypothetical protein [Candidatus Dojkabacteria bacterium]WKZ28461.1 MAG: hypothetical protein QY330_02590 [Candidatus Dojkabacteria bacterium]